MNGEQKNNLIKRFKMIFAPNIPALYGQGLTDYEILTKIGALINECVDKVESFEELAEKLDEALRDLDSFTRAEVKRIIEDMYNTGEIRDIIEDVVNGYLDTVFDEFDTFPSKTSNLEARRLARFMERRGDNDHSGTPGRRPYAVQSGTYFSYMGGNYIAYCLFSYGTNNAAALILRSATDYSLVGRVKFDGGHVDCMDFNVNDGYFYIAPKNKETDVSGQTASTDEILRIKFSTVVGSNLDSRYNNLNEMPFLEDAVDNGVEVFEISVPPNDYYADGVGYGSVSCPAEECGADEFIAGQYEIIYKYKWKTNNGQPLGDCLISDEVINELETLRNSRGIGWSWANISVTPKYIYYLTYLPSLLIRVRRDVQRVDWFYNIPTRLNDGYYNAGEPEGLKVFPNGDCYMFTLSNLHNGGQVIAREQYAMTQVYYTNLLKSTSPSYGNIYHNNTTIVHVNSAIPNYNPNGGSARPFNNILEAVDWAQSQLQFNNVLIHLHDASNPYYISICSRASITIRSVGSTQAMIGGVTVYGGAPVYFQACNFWYSLNDVVTGSAYFVVRDAVVTLRDCTFQAGQGATLGIKTAMYIRGGMVSYNYIVSTALPLPSGAQTSYHDEASWETGDGWKFIDAGDCIVNAHGLATTNANVLG